MAIDWDRWEAMRLSLDYSWQRMLELSADDKPDRQEYEALAEHAMATATRLLQSSGPDIPDLSTAKQRQRWQDGQREAMAMRERIVEQQARDQARTEAADALAEALDE